MDLQLSRTQNLRYSAGTPDQHRQTNRLYRGCALTPHNVSFPGITANVFWRPATLASHAQSGFAATAARCSPRDPTFDTRATMGCGGLEKSARVRLRMGYIWSAFWATRGRDQSSSPSDALPDLNGSRTRFLVPSGPRSQRVSLGDPT